jgi:hypothetical protein
MPPRKPGENHCQASLLNTAVMTNRQSAHGAAAKTAGHPSRGIVFPSPAALR